MSNSCAISSLPANPTHFPRQIQNIGFMCSLDLFPVPDSVYQERFHASPSPSESFREIHQGSHPAYPYTYFPLHPYTSPGNNRPQIPFQLPRRQLMLGHLKESEIPSDVVHRVGNHLVTESSKMTPAVVGEKVVEPALVDYKGRKAFIFVFGVSFRVPRRNYNVPCGSEVIENKCTCRLVAGIYSGGRPLCPTVWRFTDGF